MLGLLNLPESVKNDILHGLISMGHAKVLSKLENEELILELAEKVKLEHLSVRALEALAQNPNFKRKNEIIKIEKEDASQAQIIPVNNYGYVEEAMRDAIGSRVKIKNKKIIIPFNSDKDLERVLEILNIEVKVD